jgi:hypothetical protein
MKRQLELLTEAVADLRREFRGMFSAFRWLKWGLYVTASLVLVAVALMVFA